MTKPVTIPNVFATGNGGNVPVSLLDQDFTTLAAAINDVGTYSTYVVDTGSANAYVVTFVNGLTVSLVNGLPVTFRATNSNTAPSTVTIQQTIGNTITSLGTVSILRPDGTPLSAGDILAGRIVNGVYDAVAGAVYLNTLGAIPTGSAGSVTFDGGTLVTQFLSRVQRVVDSIATLRTISKATYNKAFATGYYAAGDGGGGAYWFNAADTTSTDNGGTIIVAADGGRWYLQWFGSVDVKQFGAKADAGTTDNSTVLANCAAWVASGAVKNKLTFSEGIYGYSVSPNWGIQNAQIEALGEVRLRYSGAGAAVILDAGSGMGVNVYNVRMGTFIVETTVSNAVFVRGIHHSRLGFKAKGAGASLAAIEVEFAVGTHFDNCTVTANEDGTWYLNAKPLLGVHLTQRNTGEQTSFCTFTNLICEGLSATNGAGIQLDNTIGNQFFGCTCEGGYYGILTGTAAVRNRFHGLDMEVNSQDDIFEQGTNNEYLGCNSSSHITVSGVALWPKFFGGSYKTILVGSGSRFALFSGVTFDNAAGGGFTNNEPTTIIDNCIDQQTQKIGPVAQGAISVGASPFTYTNLTGNKQQVSIFTNGATITGVSVTRTGTNQGWDATTRQVLLYPNDSVIVTYSAGSPTMYQYSE